MNILAKEAFKYVLAKAVALAIATKLVESGIEMASTVVYERFFEKGKRAKDKGNKRKK